MITHIYEYKGVHFRVTYVLIEDNVPEFDSVYMLDANYRPVGPNLVEMFGDIVVMTNYSPMEAEPFLSTIVKEIKNECHGIGSAS